MKIKKLNLEVQWLLVAVLVLNSCLSQNISSSESKVTTGQQNATAENSGNGTFTVP